jgi:hypothetical protein
VSNKKAIQSIIELLKLCLSLDDQELSKLTIELIIEKLEDLLNK